MFSIRMFVHYTFLRVCVFIKCVALSFICFYKYSSVYSILFVFSSFTFCTCGCNIFSVLLLSYPFLVLIKFHTCTSSAILFSLLNPFSCFYLVQLLIKFHACLLYTFSLAPSKLVFLLLSCKPYSQFPR